MFEGCSVAIVTPVRDGEIDHEAYRRLVEFQIAGGTEAIVTCGCTGEPATMTMDEHKALIAETVEIVAGRRPVIAGTGSNNTREAIELTRYAEDAGADGALLITPYYNKPMPAGLLAHYTKVAESTALPLIVYNVPSRTGISILPETVARLAEQKNIVAIKEAGGSMDQVSQLLALCPKDFTVLSGDDSMTLPIMAAGGRGVISVAANIVPAKLAKLTAAALADRWSEARSLHLELFDLFKALFLETNPIPVKAALGLMGMITAEWRLPLAPPKPQTLAALDAVLRRHGLLA